MRHDLTLEMGGAGGEFSPRGAARRRTSAHSGGGAAGESHQLVAAVRRLQTARNPVSRPSGRRAPGFVLGRPGGRLPPAKGGEPMLVVMKTHGSEAQLDAAGG